MLVSGKMVCGERSALATRAATWKGELEGGLKVLVFKVTNAPAFRPTLESCELLRARLRWGAAPRPLWLGCLALGHAGTTGHWRPEACVALCRCNFSYVNSFHN